MSSRPYRALFQIALTAAGAAVLALMSVHCDPWRLCHAQLHAGAENIVAFPRIPLPGGLHIPYRIPYGLFVALCLLAPGAAFLFRGVRAAAARLLASPATRYAAPASLACFAVSVFAGFFLQETAHPEPQLVRSTALYLSLGLGGVAMLSAGLYPRIADMALWQRLRSFLSRVRLPWLLAALFAAEFALANLISYCAFEHIPHIQDSFAQVFQGTIFAAGRLTAPSPPLKELFDYMHIINNGRWYSQYPPGHSFLLMFGVLAGAPWMVNPLLGACTVVLLYFLGRELYGDATGRLSAVLAFLSPFILFMSSEYMNHAAGLALFTLFALCYARAVRRRTVIPALIGGAALGWIVTIRPLSAAGLALAFTAHAVWLLARRFRQYWRPFLAMAVPALALTGVLLAYNYLTNGDPLLFGYQVLHGDAHLPGFGRAAWGEPLTPGLGIAHALNNIVGLNKYLFEWPIPCLTFVCILFASGRANRWDALLLAALAGLALAYVFYWYQDWCFGPRLLYEAAGCAVVLTARGMYCTPHLVRRAFGRPVPARRVCGFVAALLLLCTAYGLATNVPALYREYSSSYWSVDATVQKQVRQKGLERSVIFIRGMLYLPGNSPFLDNGIIYVWDKPGRRKDVMALFPGYRYFLSDTGRPLVELFP